MLHHEEMATSLGVSQGLTRPLSHFGAIFHQPAQIPEMDLLNLNVQPDCLNPFGGTICRLLGLDQGIM